MTKSLIASMALFLITVTLAPAANWHQWRGPNSDGVVPGEGYPTQWSADSNITWKVALPGWGTSTPAIWDDHIFVTCEDGQQNLLFSLNRAGEQQWQVNLGSSAGNHNRKASGANPSPITDGKYVYAYYRSGDLACVNFSGEVVWSTNLQNLYGRDRLNWDLGTSPVLTEKLVVVAVMHNGPSYVVGLDRATGDVAWKQARDTGAPRESKDSYSTPVVIEQDGKEQIVVVGADFVTVHDAKTGDEISRVGTLNPTQQGNYRSIASPVVSNGVIVAPYSRGRTLTGVRLGGVGDVTDSHVAWELNGTNGQFGDVPTPTALDGRVYVCGDRGDVQCLDMATGQNVWTERLPRGDDVFSSSPMLADGKLYLTREDGTTYVVAVGDEPKLIATNALGERTYATPAFADGQVFIRTSEFLFCIGERTGE